MFILAAVTVAIFAVGYWSAITRLAQLGNSTVSNATKLSLTLLGLVLIPSATVLLVSGGAAAFFGEFLVLCVGQIFGYIFGGRVA